MRKLLSAGFAVWLGLFPLIPVADAQEPVDSVMNARIRDEGLKRSKVYETFTHFTEVIGPRLTGTPAHKTAAEYARDRLKEWGFQTARLEPWEFGRGWTLEKQTIEMIEPRYMPLLGYAEAWSAGTAGEIVGTPLMLGGKSAAELEPLRSKIKGAIVLSQPIQTVFEDKDRPQPTTAPGDVAIGQPRHPPEQTARANAQALTQMLRQEAPGVVLRTSMGMHGTMFVLGRDNGPNTLPSIVLAAEHYNLIARMVQLGVPVKLRVNLQTRFYDQDKNSYNVIAELPGVDPALKDEVVMLGGHLDSWHSATGASDNADGAAVAMEALRILKAVGAQPKRTIRVALWSGEEEGLLGSAKYVDRYLKGDDKKAEREKMSVYLNIDPGTGPIYGFYMENNEAAKAIFDAWLEPFRDLGMRRNVLPGIGATDHLSFTRVGIPGFNVVQEYTDYDVRMHHTNVDTFERVRESDLQQNAIVLASFLYHAAMRKEKIPPGKPAVTPSP
ncbi:MAG TPA: M20/M25/M40 family metallo-hydrolase [Pyrinomonadaceae bacterium]|nr:M20/M25/M40 family metallo-hydrolase [Pyrinomonadaceae bacterium]